MKKINSSLILIILVGVIFVGALAGVTFIASKALDNTANTDTNKDDPAEKAGPLDVATDTVTDTQSESAFNAGGTEGGDGTATDENVIKKGDDELALGFINDGTKMRIGYYTTSLKPNTKYKITWSISSMVFKYTSARLLRKTFQVTTDNGVVVDKEYPYVAIDTSYKANDGNFNTFYGTDGEVLYNTSGVQIISEAEGDMLFVALFECDFTDLENAKLTAQAVGKYVVEFTIVELAN